MSAPGVIRRLFGTATHAVRTAVGVVTTIIIVARPNRAGSERARKNAERIIAACKAFRERHGRFPDTLEELVPEFFPELPPAKYAGPHFGFVYDVSGGELGPKRHVLGWTELIPFGRPFYVLEEERWGYLD
ncbi:hypothetical protein [Hyalangium rubrum]|uniref:Lipoprotein n=1 Tax=Hyalangium rubrum TaxID=3103134 RepID=A0ABU5H4N6_9BACT|nr:hypothetical protein [Hyalangium sp. s54d21]MDY7228440.1 hypothetical protein [Hyalangium sp. s54d21]